MIVFVDEAGFYLLPGLVCTWAPRGQTPILKVPYTRDHLSVIGAITPSGKLYLMVQQQACWIFVPERKSILKTPREAIF